MSSAGMNTGRPSAEAFLIATCSESDRRVVLDRLPGTAGCANRASAIHAAGGG
jgi:hypothetical protein